MPKKQSTKSQVIQVCVIEFPKQSSEAVKTYFGVDITESSLFVAFAVSEDNYDIVAQIEMFLT